MKSISLVLCLAFGVDAFTPGVSTSMLTSRRAAATVRPVSYLSEVDDDEDKDPAWIAYQKEQEGESQGRGVNEGPVNYDSFIDCEGFDGGDGQVGVVGSKDNALDKFDRSGAVKTGSAQERRGAGGRGAKGIGGDSKQVQKNLFGYTTGYSEKLKDKGMVDIDDNGEDRLYARRQQLENWRNQQELKLKQVEGLQEMAARTGVEYDSRRATQSYFNALDSAEKNDDAKWNMYKGEAKDEALTEAVMGMEKGDVTETFEVTAAFPKPSFFTVKVFNDINPYQDFKVGFSSDTPDGAEDWQVAPLSGELNRRGGDPTELSVVFKPRAPGGAPREAWMIVETEESRWTYHLIGTVQ